MEKLLTIKEAKLLLGVTTYTIKSRGVDMRGIGSGLNDLITIIAHFSGKLYGMRSNKQKEVVKNVKNILAPDWSKIVKFTGYKSTVELVDPHHTSKDMPKDGGSSPRSPMVR
ncbi:MAG: hypothetical protein ACXQTW_05205 [Candidatus Methanospirareceae archaeon]